MKTSFELENNWMVEWDDEIWQFSKNYTNYLAIVTPNTDANAKSPLKYDWLPLSKESDLAFGLARVKVGDILAGGHKHAFNKNHRKQVFMRVVAKTDDLITVLIEDTYRKANNA